MSRSPSVTAASSSPLHRHREDTGHSTPVQSCAAKLNCPAMIACGILKHGSSKHCQQRPLPTECRQAAARLTTAPSLCRSQAPAPRGACRRQKERQAERQTAELGRTAVAAVKQVHHISSVMCTELNSCTQLALVVSQQHSHAAALHEEFGPLGQQVVSCPGHGLCHRQL